LHKDYQLASITAFMVEYFEIPNAPRVSGLRFRGINAPDDYANINKIIMASSKVDKLDYSETVEDVSNYYKHLANCDLSRDVLFAEANAKSIGYSRVWFIERTDEPGYIYQFFVHLLPEWRGKGIRDAMLKWCESRIKQISRLHPDEAKKDIFIYLMDTQMELGKILESNNYKIVRYGFQMVRPNLENIPDCPLPEGLEIRPVKPEHYRMVWDATEEASKDGWMVTKAEEEDYQKWLAHRLFRPDLWQVAWDGDRVAGAVQSFIDPQENAEFGRKRGWTENIHVGREWRGKGLAQALIAGSFQILKDNGMEEAALGVDAENSTGALHLYKKMGFKEDKTDYTYSKSVDAI
jgi:mycothiol synthase